MTVSGLTMASAERQSRQRWDRQIHNRRSPEVNFGRFLADLRSTPIWWRRAKFSSWRAACERKIEDRVARNVVREMSIGENYEGNITPFRSDISRFLRGTGTSDREALCFGTSIWIYGNPGERRSQRRSRANSGHCSMGRRQAEFYDLDKTSHQANARKDNGERWRQTSKARPSSGRNPYRQSTKSLSQEKSC
jgi:hypothetical protein